MQLAPFDDPSWEIWGCSPGLHPFAKRVDAWFEIHRWEDLQKRVSLDYINFMAKLACPVYMIRPIEGISGSRPYPLDAVLHQPYGWTVSPKGEWRQKYFDRCDFASTISWMIALAIHERVDEIGLWGVDMSATEEWAFQRSGCQSLIEVAKSVGITVTVPGEADILRPPPLYGFGEVDPAHIKIAVRKKEIDARMADSFARGQAAQREHDYLRGARDNIEYQAMTWVGNPYHMAENLHARVDPVVFTAEPPPLNGGGEAPSPAQAEPDDWRGLEEALNEEPPLSGGGGSQNGGGGTSIPAAVLNELSTAIDNALANGALGVEPRS